MLHDYHCASKVGTVRDRKAAHEERQDFTRDTRETLDPKGSRFGDSRFSRRER